MPRDRAYYEKRKNELLGGRGFFPSDDPSQWLQDGINLLAEMSDARDDSDYYPLTDIDKAIKLGELYTDLAMEFLNRKLVRPAAALFLSGWNEFGQVQLDTKKRVYRAALANSLSTVYQFSGDEGAAVRWALYAHADDMLGEHLKGGGDAKKKLATIWGMNPEAFEAFDAIAAENLTKIDEDCNGDWSQVPGFAEDVVRRFALEKPQFAHLFAEESRLQEFPLSKAYFSTLLERVNASYPQGEETAKGKALQDLASYLFLLVPGWVPRENLYDEFESYETDIVVRNLNRAGNLTAELLGRHFLVECKNWTKSVRVPEVGYFLYRMRLTHAKFGVMFAKSDISGDPILEKQARSLIRKAFHEDGNVCIVVTQGDFDMLAAGKVSFWPLLLERIERVRFGAPKGS